MSIHSILVPSSKGMYFLDRSFILEGIMTDHIYIYDLLRIHWEYIFPQYGHPSNHPFIPSIQPPIQAGRDTCRKIYTTTQFNTHIHIRQRCVQLTNKTYSQSTCKIPGVDTLQTIFIMHSTPSLVPKYPQMDQNKLQSKTLNASDSLLYQ